MNSELKKNDKTVYVKYRDKLCMFYPDKVIENSDEIKGKVVFIERGSYNPNSWYVDITVSKNDIIYN